MRLTPNTVQLLAPVNMLNAFVGVPCVLLHGSPIFIRTSNIKSTVSTAISQNGK
jgi:hypothetical protein